MPASQGFPDRAPGVRARHMEENRDFAAPAIWTSQTTAYDVQMEGKASTKNCAARSRRTFG